MLLARVAGRSLSGFGFATMRLDAKGLSARVVCRRGGVGVGSWRYRGLGRELLYVDGTLAQGATTTHDVASGTQDAYISSVARALKAYRGAVLVRLFGGEFNGSWWKNVSPRANPSLTTADFVNAWRRVAG